MESGNPEPFYLCDEHYQEAEALDERRRRDMRVRHERWRLLENKVSDAVVLWTGYGRSDVPVRDDAAVIENFGGDAVHLVPMVHHLWDEFQWVEAADGDAGFDRDELVVRASTRLHLRQAHLSDTAVDALIWSYYLDP
jgi:hypothetical protein